MISCSTDVIIIIIVYYRRRGHCLFLVVVVVNVRNTSEMKASPRYKDKRIGDIHSFPLRDALLPQCIYTQRLYQLLLLPYFHFLDSE